MTSTRYSGPVKTSYKSPHTKMKLKRSGFLPVAGGSDLISRHMEAHYRRVAMATSKVDTSPPVSMLTSTKARDRARNKRPQRRSLLEIPVANSRKTSLQLINYGGVKPSASFTSACMLSRQCESDAGFASMTESVSLESLHITDVIPDGQTLMSLGGSHSEPTRTDCGYLGDWSSESTERKLKYKELFEFSLEQGQDEIWQLYHTRTGQQTATAKLKQKHTQCKSGQKSSPPWKPAFSPNSSSRSSIPPYSSYSPTVHVRPSLAPIHKPKASVTVGDKVTRVENTNLEAAHTEADSIHGLPITSVENLTSEVTTKGADFGVVGARTTFTVSDGAKVREEVSAKGGEKLLMEEEDMLPSGLPTSSDSSPQCKQSGREMIAEAGEYSHQAMVVCKRSQEIKKSIELEIEETAYLNFIAGVTQDILSRGTLSNATMTLLFDSHIERHKHSLRKDIMIKKINSLMKQLGINHHTRT